VNLGRFEFILALVFLAFGYAALGESVAEPAGKRATTQPTTVSGREVAHWTRLPFLAETAVEHGFEIPEPLGISGSYYTEKQNFEITDLKIGLGDDALLGIDKLIVAGDARTRQTIWNSHFDCWLLPFLNVYGILGYMDGGAKIKLGPLGVPVYDFKLNYEGPVLGVGSTLAGGFRPFKDRSTILFGQADLSHTTAFLDFDKLGLSLNEGVNALVLSLRVGMRDRIRTKLPLGEMHFALWGGTMCQAVQRVLPGHLEMLGLALSVDKKACSPCNPIVGGRLEIGQNLDVMIEAGFGDRQSLMLMATYRF